MSTHLDNLIFYIPDLSKRKILDVGAGKGKFLIECIERGFDASGIEYNQENVNKIKEITQDRNLNVNIKRGTAENIPSTENGFDFLNFSEVIEHVRLPENALKEAHRVLKPKGLVYMSVPNRFGWFDQHFRLAFVNWVPRSCSDVFIYLFGEHKDYQGQSGLQSLREMHYYTYNKFVREANQAGFSAQDIREIKIKNKLKNHLIILFFAIMFYKFLRLWYFDSFHFKLIKNG